MYDIITIIITIKGVTEPLTISQRICAGNDVALNVVTGVIEDESLKIAELIKQELIDHFQNDPDVDTEELVVTISLSKFCVHF